MKRILVLIKKEIKELITPQLVLPLVVTVIIFSFIGNIISSEKKKSEKPQPISILNQDGSEFSQNVITFLSQNNFETSVLTNNLSQDEAIEKIKTDKSNFLLIIPENFEENINAYQPQDLKIYKNITNFSLTGVINQQMADSIIALINESISNYWISQKTQDINPAILKNPIQKEEHLIVNDKQSKVDLNSVMNFISQQTTFIPIIMMLVITLASQMVAMAMAQEKESKTFETLLSLPIDRKSIVFAKLISAGLVSILFASVYMVGYKNYLGSIMGTETSQVTEGLSTSLEELGITFGTGDYFLLGTTLFLGILIALAIAMILGLFTENVKSIQAVITPLMIVLLIPYLVTMFLDINSISPVFRYIIYALPLSQPFLAIQNVVFSDYKPIIYGIIYQVIIFTILIFTIAKIFSSDKALSIRLKIGKK